MPRPQTVAIDDLHSAEDAQAFRALNHEWITQIFTLEDEDRRQLEDPVGQLVRPGGAVLLARVGDQIVGCVALAPTRPGVVELVKMAVSPAHQGHGIGRALISSAIDKAHALRCSRIELESNRKLAPAVHLYEAYGFRHLGTDEHEPGPYARADVAMALDLD